MNTPVLSKKQQQKKLSAKKGLRNVLAQPYEKYWPVLGEGEESTLEGLLNRLLPELQSTSKSLNWRDARNMSKEERRAAREKLKTEADATENSCRKAVSMGVNAVTRDLEKNNLSSVLLDSTVESLMIKHVIVMAQSKGIPILLVPFLKSTTLENIGFACAAIGIKNEGAKDVHPFHEVHQEIVRCAPPPSAQKVLITNGNDSTATAQDLSKDDEMSKEMSNGDEMPHDQMSEDTENTPANPPFTLSTDVYKYRLTRNERIFVPPGTAEKVAGDKEWSEFIAIEKDDMEIDVGKVLIPRKNQRYMDIHAKDHKSSPEATKPGEQKGSKYEGKKQNTTYVPLKVKRVQGNMNRLKAGKQKKSSLEKKSSNKS